MEASAAFGHPQHLWRSIWPVLCLDMYRGSKTIVPWKSKLFPYITISTTLVDVAVYF